MNETTEDLVTPEDKLKLLFPDRPWETEPDEAEWVDTATGYKCVIKRNDSTGTLCGYVGIPRGHSLYGMTYQGLEGMFTMRVHGGLTFSGNITDGKDDYHYFGFDTAHAGDLCPKLAVVMLRWRYTDSSGVWSYHKDNTYRTFEYVKFSVQELVSQLGYCDIKGRYGI